MSKYWIMMFSSVIIASFSQVFLKMSTKKKYENFIKEYVNPHVIVGYGMMLVSTILMIFSFQKLDYKNGPVIESFGYILVMLLSLIFFNEKITKRKLFGNILILLGVLIFYL